MDSQEAAAADIAAAVDIAVAVDIAALDTAAADTAGVGVVGQPRVAGSLSSRPWREQQQRVS